MSKPTAVLFCPGRGSYTKEELGFVARTVQSGPGADALAISDKVRRQQGRKTLTEVDGADRFRPSLHRDGARTPDVSGYLITKLIAEPNRNPLLIVAPAPCTANVTPTNPGVFGTVRKTSRRSPTM
jgi:hypothetical protein